MLRFVRPFVAACSLLLTALSSPVRSSETVRPTEHIVVRHGVEDAKILELVGEVVIDPYDMAEGLKAFIIEINGTNHLFILPINHRMERAVVDDDRPHSYFKSRRYDADKGIVVPCGEIID